MKEKHEIVSNWLPRYTGTPLEGFGQHILLTNFGHYLEVFCRADRAPSRAARDRPMPNATADGITLINFGMGSANAATVMDLLGAIAPKAVLFLGKCGGLKKKNQIGDLVLPIAAIRGEGTSNDYLPAGSAGTAGLRAAARGLDHDPRPRPRLLDRHGLHHQPPRVGARRGLQGIPAQDPLHGHRHGDRDDLRRRLRQLDPLRRAAAGQRPADDPGGRQDRGLRPQGHRRTSSSTTSRSASRRCA